MKLFKWEVVKGPNGAWLVTQKRLFGGRYWAGTNGYNWRYHEDAITYGSFKEKEKAQAMCDFKNNY